ncbi:MAG: ester cyclase [Hyphomicrobium sp.]|jgi:steroid delta-isomerase-like uncharacterized protein
MKTVPSSKHLESRLAAFTDEVWSSGRIDRCAEYVAAAYTIDHDPGDPWDGKTLDLEGYIDRVRRSRAPFPDQKFHIREMISDKNRVVMTWLWTATHAGDYPGFPATGQPLTMSGATMYYFNDDEKLTGHWQITDRLGVYQQLQRSKSAARESPG